MRLRNTRRRRISRSESSSERRNAEFGNVGNSRSDVFDVSVREGGLPAFVVPRCHLVAAGNETTVPDDRTAATRINAFVPLMRRLFLDQHQLVCRIANGLLLEIMLYARRDDRRHPKGICSAREAEHRVTVHVWAVRIAGG